MKKGNNMKVFLKVFVMFITLTIGSNVNAQLDSAIYHRDSLNSNAIINYQKLLEENSKIKQLDSLKRMELETKLNSLKTTDNLKKEELQQQLNELSNREQQRLIQKKARIDSLRNNSTAYPVIGLLKDTLFYIYSRFGATTASDRSINISKRIKKLYDDDFLKVDSIKYIKSDNSIDIVYDDLLIMSISETDALWNNQSIYEMANLYTKKIKNAIIYAKSENKFTKVLIRVGLILLVIGGVYFLIWLIGKGYIRLLEFINQNKENIFKDIRLKDYTFLSETQEYQISLLFFKIFRWFLVLIILYFSIPLMFSIFPFSRGWADNLFSLVWLPLKKVFISVWNYLPNLFTVLVIFFVMRYFIRFVRYIFNEIDLGKLNFNGFHSDWAMPTFSIVKFLLYAFMFVLIFPYLPGSDSNIFKGVSVFVGVLFSLGSSSAIANMVAGLVITYMRPFKIGDRIKIGDITGDVLEKTLLVTRLVTIKNEIITIPNSTILSGNTTNYSSLANEKGLIIHTTVTIGYDVPWIDIQQALIDAALRTKLILHKPAPFVLQTSLDDFYVAYQINAYTNEANKQAVIYSELHQNIQDTCNESNIEILSPHYRAERDGNMTTIPAKYNTSK